MLRTGGNKRIDALSKGMAQKVQFIGAIAARPSLVILDEPFTGLDPVNMEALRDAVLFLREQGTTVVFSTHDMDMAERLCDTIFMIFKGRKVLDGTLDEIQNEYPANRVRVRYADPNRQPPALPEVLDTEFNGRSFVLTLDRAADSSALLPRLNDHGELHQFEVIRPSLHEIFVQIAHPSAEDLRGSSSPEGEPA